MLDGRPPMSVFFCDVYFWILAFRKEKENNRKLKDKPMNKKEKIIAICFIFSFLCLIISSITTIIKTKPNNFEFKIEKLFK